MGHPVAFLLPVVPRRPAAFLRASASAATGPGPGSSPDPRSGADPGPAAPRARRTRKPRGYWSDPANLRRELEAYQAAAGAAASAGMPTARELRAAGRRDLDNAIGAAGGYAAVAATLGLARAAGSRRAAGYWDDFTNVERELRAFAAESEYPGAMPSQHALRAAGRADLATALARHGGAAAVALRVGLRPGRGRGRGAWAAWGDVERELLAFMRARPGGERAGLPTQAALRAAGRSDLATAIDRHGGLGAAARRLGLEPRGNRFATFAPLALAVYDAAAAAGAPDCMPTTAQLRAAGRADVAAALARHGGVAATARRLGLAHRARRAARDGGGGSRVFATWATLERALRVFIDRHGTTGTLPSARLLSNFRRDDLAAGMLLHGGPVVVARRMGLRRAGWSEFHEVAADVLRFARSHGAPGVMPTEQDLRDVGRTGLEAAVARMGYEQMATRLGLAQPRLAANAAFESLLGADDADDGLDVADGGVDWVE